MIPGTVSIHLVSPGAASREEDERVLTNPEKSRAASFRFPEDAARWTSFRAALRRILGEAIQVPPHEVPLVLTEFGKPVLAEPFACLHFSLSHCNDLALVALCADGPVGVDLEPLSRAPDLLGCETGFCHLEELASLPVDPSARARRLLEIWTAKEALLKALGTGFSHPPENVRIHFGASTLSAVSITPLPGMQDQVLRLLHHPALALHCASLSSPSSVSLVEVREK